MGMLHLYLLVTFSTFLSVRSCVKTGNKSCPYITGSSKTFGGTTAGHFSSRIVIFVLPSPSITLKKFEHTLAAGRIRFLHKETTCQHNRTPGCSRSDFEILCPYRPPSGNDRMTTNGTTISETVTLTTPSLSTPNVINTSSTLACKLLFAFPCEDGGLFCVTFFNVLSNFTSNWTYETGSNVRGQAYVKLQWTINSTKCSPMNHNGTLMAKRTGNPCNDTVSEKSRQHAPDANSATIRGLRADANYTVTHTVMCSNGRIGHNTYPIHTAESVPTVAPMNITVIPKRLRGGRCYLIFKWNEPPCDEKNGKITNYDFIFIKNDSKIHNVTPKKFTVLQVIDENATYSFKVRANTARGFGTYSSLNDVNITLCTPL